MRRLLCLVTCGLLTALLLVVPGGEPPVGACCPVPRPGTPVLNADQTVLIVWDAEKQMQHWIRKASFRSDDEDFGFLIPTPTEPELAESGNDAFPILSRLTEPGVRRVPSAGGLGCSGPPAPTATTGAVRVLQEKLVAGFQAAVLAADSASDLAEWLAQNGYNRTPQIEAWVRPYVEKGWKLTALKIARDKTAEQPVVEASALRLSFRTEIPIFPYREPDSTEAVAELHPRERLLRIFFVGAGRFEGALEGSTPWTGTTAWSGPVERSSRDAITTALQLPSDIGPTDWWLTEFEDRWPYAQAPSDLLFRRSADQTPVQRVPRIEYYHSTLLSLLPCVMLLALFGAPLLMMVRLLRRPAPRARSA